MTDSEKIILDGGFVICRVKFELWELVSDEATFPLVSSSDFRRVISLLEMPIESVKLALGLDFPCKNVVEIGLRHDSDYWIKLAISWVAHSSAQEVNFFVEDLEKLSKDKAVSQNIRHLARKELKRLLNS